MNYATFWSHKIAVMFFCLCISFAFTMQVRAQGKQAILILRLQGDGSLSGCEGTTEVNYQIVNNLKLNNKEEIRLVSGISATRESSGVPRKAYEDSGKSKLQDLTALKWEHDGLLYAVSLRGSAPILALPDNMKPQKNADPPLSSFYSAMLSGEVRDGKQKRQINVSLREVWKVYFVPEGASVNDTLFKHAAEEKSVGLWEAYFRKTNNYRSDEANTYMRDALFVCARADLNQFAKGDYAALEKARQKTERAKSVKEDNATRQLSLDISEEQGRVNKTRVQIDQLIREGKWDEAISAAEPIKIYLTTWPDLNDMYNHAVKESHVIHLSRGKDALQAKQLEVALENCTTAWHRLRDSVPARDCVCSTRNEIALRDANSQRQQKRPKNAKELLEKQLADSDCSQEARVLANLKETNCEYAQQLFDEAKQLLGASANNRPAPTATVGQRGGRGRLKQPPATQPPAAKVKAISAQNRNDFREARSRLLQSNQLCDSEPMHALLEATNRRLSDYCVVEAKKASQRGDDGTAYVYLRSAQEYTLGDDAVSGLITEARDRFAQKTRVNIGTAFGDRSGSRYGASLINQVSAEVESAAAGAGLNQPVILDREQAANAARAIQSGRSLSGPTVVFFGELLIAAIRGDRNSRDVPATFQYYNPQRKREDQAIDEVKNNESNCKKQNGPAACGGYADQLARMRAHRDSLPRNLTQSYTYRETTYRIEGNVKMSFRSTNSISRGVATAETLESSVDQRCLQREGMRDYSGNYASDPPCNLEAEENYISQMTGKIMSDARSRAHAELVGLPHNYYSHARSAPNRQQAVEDYLRFLFLSRDKSGSEAQEARTFILSFDPELKTDGVLR